MIKTHSPLKSWEFLKSWDIFFDEIGPFLDKQGSFCPKKDDIFKALELTPFEDVKVVILGQDPYPTKGHAHGLAFSVQPHVKPIPPSLRQIFAEYRADLGHPQPSSGDLRAWAERGVLLLNTILTVAEGKPLSHKGIGWEKMTYEIIRSLANRGNCVFVLWGRKAQEYKAACGDCPVIESPHPSPLAKGFLGSKPFSKINEALKGLKLTPVEWKLQ